MRFSQLVTVMGLKSSKGEYEGTRYDSTKVYAQIPLDDSKGTAKGFACQEYTMGDSTEYNKYSHLEFPFSAEADMEIVSSGKAQKIVMHSLRPVARGAAATKAAA